ncbi:MAG: peptidoglycan-binding domain-containing protein [Anaeromyxobacter sp.]
MPNPQNVNLVTLELVLQRYPGTDGSDADRAIADVDYKLTVAGHVSQGKTGADGKIHVALPANAKATLEMLGSTYEVTPVGALEAKDTVLGVQRRLQGLGYELGRVDGVVGVKTGLALLQFQADNAPLDTLGDITHAATQEQLKTQYGE